MPASAILFGPHLKSRYHLGTQNMLNREQLRAFKQYLALRTAAAEAMEEARKAREKHINAELMAARKLSEFVSALEQEAPGVHL